MKTSRDAPSQPPRRRTRGSSRGRVSRPAAPGRGRKRSGPQGSAPARSTASGSQGGPFRRNRSLNTRSYTSTTRNRRSRDGSSRPTAAYHQQAIPANRSSPTGSRNLSDGSGSRRRGQAQARPTRGSSPGGPLTKKPRPRAAQARRRSRLRVRPGTRRARAPARTAPASAAASTGSVVTRDPPTNGRREVPQASAENTPARRSPPANTEPIPPAARMERAKARPVPHRAPHSLWPRTACPAADSQ